MFKRKPFAPVFPSDSAVRASTAPTSRSADRERAMPGLSQGGTEREMQKQGPVAEGPQTLSPNLTATLGNLQKSQGGPWTPLPLAWGFTLILPGPQGVGRPQLASGLPLCFLIDPFPHLSVGASIIPIFP